jgi:hypothetical protein
MQLSYCLGRSKRAPFENLSPLGVALVVLLAGLLPSDAAAKQPLLHEQWLAGWQDRWQHSQDPAFDGKFTVVTVNGTSDRALLVGWGSCDCRSCYPCSSCEQQAVVCPHHWMCGSTCS